MEKNAIRLAIVIPCYNEEQVIPETFEPFQNQLFEMIKEGLCSQDSFLLYCNDGSTDNTWEIICEYAKNDPVHCKGLSLSRNRGHQNVLLAGLMEAKETCDAAISIDVDGQDDIPSMEAMLRSYLEGYDVVYGVRSDRTSDTFMKRFTAQMFYKLLKLMGVESVYNHADYRLMSRRALNALSQDKEVNLFLRGMVPLVGFRSTTVEYVRHERLAGKSHYSIPKMLALAVGGITSLSIKPIRIISVFGLLVAFASFLSVLWVLISYFQGDSVAGWASTTSLLCFLSGVQIMCTGIIGEYVGRTYLEAKGRPRYIVSERTYDRQSR